MQTTLIARDQGYRLLPFRFMRLDLSGPRNILLTAETGEYIFLTEEELSETVKKRLNPSSDLYKDLLAQHFIYEPENHNPIPEIAAQYRSRKAFIFDGPALHLFVVTLRCNHTCQYCQVSRAPLIDSKHDMTSETARHAVNRLFESPSPSLTVEFQGGEPLLNFTQIKNIVELINERNEEEQRNIQFVITSTLHHLDDNVIDFSRRHGIIFSTSLDGPAFIHNANRPTPTKDSYERTIEGIRRIKAELGPDFVSALTTLTAKSLESPQAIIDEYIEQGFKSISLRPLSPYGFAKKSQSRLDYSTSDYISFYKRALQYLISVNNQGTYLSEGFTSLLLLSILTPFSSGYVDHRSPLGAGIGTLVYNYDGDVYPSDEARMLVEMGENGLRLGNVKEPLSKLLTAPIVELLLSAGIAESLPGCSECALLPYCGTDPIDHFARQGDPVGHRAFSAFCQKNTAILTHLFGILRDGSEQAQRVLLSWLSRRSLSDLPANGHRVA